MKIKPVHILLIEDDKDDYLLFDKYAKKLTMPCNVEWVSSYDDGIRALKKDNTYDLCFVDYRLGEKDGIDFIKEVKKRNIPQGIIMLTGLGDDELGIRAMQVGADDYYNKSGLNVETLNRAIRFTLERRKTRQQEYQLTLALAEKQHAEQQKTYLSNLLEELRVIQDRLNIAQKAGNIGTFQWNIPEDKNVWSEELEELYGLEIGTFQGTLDAWRKGVHPEDIERVVKQIEEALQNKIKDFEAEWRIIRPDKTIRQIYAKAQFFYDKKGTPLHMIGINMDITERKRLEKQKDDFIGIASHELKTPVTSIKAYTQVLQSRFRKADDMQSVELLEKMNSQLNKLTGLIGDLLDITKIEGGKLVFNEEYFDFNELVTEVVEEVQRTTQRHKIILELAKTHSVFGDRDRVGQVVTNFLTNAIKYSPKADTVILSTKSNGKFITCSVKDMGVGISKADQAKVFERFYRVGGVGLETYPGLGLGLYISAEIIRRQKGKIWVESEKGKGSTFSFSLPITKQK